MSYGLRIYNADGSIRRDYEDSLTKVILSGTVFGGTVPNNYVEYRYFDSNLLSSPDHYTVFCAASTTSNFTFYNYGDGWGAFSLQTGIMPTENNFSIVSPGVLQIKAVPGVVSNVFNVFVWQTVFTIIGY